MTVYSGAHVVVNVDAAPAGGTWAARSPSMEPQLGGPLAFDGAAARNVGDPLVFDGDAQPGVSGATNLGEWEVLEGAVAFLGDSLGAEVFVGGG
eukprot:CAMPEP_0113553008 /NCGR_PEP_ID=MMETSP0015_2-20120614/15375_1 /TAXON_ID=2838 /ORGANISM="Odontella" /LENGTH=93 /DNA_ID=CAMNT_0000454031 /DNA_START=195 /DNA_END=474 /DNA_ORIENTATION=+ /assembly_acc=CAM_ASM_000160